MARAGTSDMEMLVYLRKHAPPIDPWEIMVDAADGSSALDMVAHVLDDKRAGPRVHTNGQQIGPRGCCGAAALEALSVP